MMLLFQVGTNYQAKISKKLNILVILCVEFEKNSDFFMHGTKRALQGMGIALTKLGHPGHFLPKIIKTCYIGIPMRRI